MSYIVTTAQPWKACLEVQWGTDVGMWEYTKYIRVVKIEQIRGGQIAFATFRAENVTFFFFFWKKDEKVSFFSNFHNSGYLYWYKDLRIVHGKNHMKKNILRECYFLVENMHRKIAQKKCRSYITWKVQL